MLKSAIIAFALFVMSVTARDVRQTCKLKKGRTVAEFCKAWSNECYKYVEQYPNSTNGDFKYSVNMIWSNLSWFRYVPMHQPHAEVGELCERGPKADEAQAYCDGHVVNEHGAAVAKILHDQPV